MTIKKVKQGQWLIIEGDIQTRSLFRLLKGKIGVFKDGEKIKSVEINKRDKPKMVGFLAALSASRTHTASVKTETEVELEPVEVNHLRGILQYDVPKEIKNDIDKMIYAIDMSNQLKSLKKKLSCLPHLKLDITKIHKNMSPDVSEVLLELSDLYRQVVNEKRPV